MKRRFASEKLRVPITRAVRRGACTGRGAGPGRGAGAGRGAGRVPPPVPLLGVAPPAVGPGPADTTIATAEPTLTTRTAVGATTVPFGAFDATAVTAPAARPRAARLLFAAASVW